MPNTTCHTSISLDGFVTGIVDELHPRYRPVLLGSGERIFDGVEAFGMEPVEVPQSPLATHIRYRRVG